MLNPARLNARSLAILLLPTSFASWKVPSFHHSFFDRPRSARGHCLQSVYATRLHGTPGEWLDRSQGLMSREWRQFTMPKRKVCCAFPLELLILPVEHATPQAVRHGPYRGLTINDAVSP